MNLEKFRNYCLSKKGATEDFPFDITTLVFRVGGKIFALTDTDKIPFRFNLKCEYERAVELREQYEFIIAGYHMNKKLWNTIEPNGSQSDKFYYELVDHSYDLIFKSLSKKEREAIGL